MSQVTTSFNRQLAGLRGLAVTVVVLLHVGLSGFDGGYLGVDLFFVLSGLLITNSLLGARKRGGPFLAEFYWHRFLRLFPALALLCLTVVLVSGFNEGRIRDVAAALGYIGNWTRAVEAGAPTYLGHTWSLAIEEQFYMLWPLLLLSMLALISIRQTACCTVILAVAVMAWRAFAAANGATANMIYNGLHFRADGLLLGCALALLSYDNPSSTAERLETIVRRLILPALLVVGALFATLGSLDARMLQFGYSAASSSLVVVVAYFYLPMARPRSLDAFFGSRFMVWLGEISYGVYLWHFPISFYLHHEPWFAAHPWMRIFLSILISLVCATLSYRLVEQPARSLRKWEARRAALAGGLTVAYAFTAFAVAGWLFFEGNIRGALVPGYKVQILAYGPREVQPGVPFNVQGDGSSALWISTNDRVRTDVRIKFGETAISANANGNFVSALVPLGIIPASGRVEVSLTDGALRPISDPVTISISSGRDAD